MLKAKFFQPRILKTAVAKFHENNISELRVVAVCDGVIGDSQAVMSVIGILADMGEDSLESVAHYSELDFIKFHGENQDDSTDNSFDFDSGYSDGEDDEWSEICEREERHSIAYREENLDHCNV